MSLRVRNDYFEGFIRGVRKAFKENVKENSLIVVQGKEVVDYVSKKNLRSGRISMRASFGDMTAYDKGYGDGLYSGRSRGKKVLV